MPKAEAKHLRIGLRTGTLQIKEHSSGSKEASENKDMALMAHKHWAKSLYPYCGSSADLCIGGDT